MMRDSTDQVQGTNRGRSAFWRPGSVISQNLGVEDVPLMRARTGPPQPASYIYAQHPPQYSSTVDGQHWQASHQFRDSYPVLIRDESAGPASPPQYYVAQEPVAWSPGPGAVVPMALRGSVAAVPTTGQFQTYEVSPRAPPYGVPIQQASTFQQPPPPLYTSFDGPQIEPREAGSDREEVAPEQVQLIPARQSQQVQQEAKPDEADDGNVPESPPARQPEPVEGIKQAKDRVKPNPFFSKGSRLSIADSDYSVMNRSVVRQPVQDLPQARSHASLKTCADRKFTVKGSRVNMDVSPPLLEPAEKHIETMKVSVVSFDAIEYLQTEGEPTIDLIVQRSGLLSSKVEVDWRNDNVNTPPESYKQQHGVVTFFPGETKKTISLELLDDPHWNLEAMQNVILTITPGSGAVLGNLYKASVSVINNDAFPNGKAPEPDRRDKMTVIKNFLMHNYNLMKRETISGLLYECYPGIYQIANQVILQLLVDYALNNKKYDRDQTQMAYLYTLMSAYVLNFALLNLFDWLFLRLRLGGKCQIQLRTAITATAVQFTNKESSKSPPGITTRVTEADVKIATDSVWTSSFTLFSSIFTLLCNITYTWVLNLMQLDEIGVWFTIMLCLIPVLIGFLNYIVLQLTYDKSALQSYEAGEAGDEVARWGADLLRLRQMICNFRQEGVGMLRYKRLHAEFNKLSYEGAVLRDNACWLARWCATILSAVLLGIVGYLVIKNDDKSVSNFVTLFNTMNSLSNSLSSLFAATYTILEGYGPILRICEILNAETQHKLRISKEKYRRDLLAKVERSGTQRDILPDELRIQGVSYTHDEHNELFPALSLGIQAGQIVAIRAGAAVGKKTILQLLAQQIQPTAGVVWVPSNWLIRYIDTTPTLFDITLMENLRFGQTFNHTDDEIWDMCRYFGMNPDLINKPDMEVGEAGNRLSFTDSMMVSLVRAMLSSPDLVLLPGTLDVLGEDLARNVSKRLQQYVKDRKFECLRSENEHRSDVLLEPKTIIISTKLEIVEGMADAVLAISPVDGLKQETMLP